MLVINTNFFWVIKWRFLKIIIFPWWNWILIFNEIIIINACGLEEGTKEGLLTKEKIEKNGNLKSINDSGTELNESNYINESIYTNEEDNNDSFWTIKFLISILF